MIMVWSESRTMLFSEFKNRFSLLVVNYSSKDVSVCTRFY